MSMRITDIIEVFEEWAPKWVAWEKDNVGLQVGDKQRTITRVLVTLDVTKQTVAEAIAKKTELIVSHHPLLFRPPSTITTNDTIGELVLQLAEHGIALFSAHTNLDFAQGGVSFALAKTLKLEDVRFLSPLKNSLAKIAVFVPEGHVEHVMHAMAKEGAGIIGEYSSCSFRMNGRGSFRASSTSNPFIGKRGNLEFVEETRLEMIAPRANVSRVIAAMKAVHPYEEVAYDVYLVENPSSHFGMGAVGKLSKPQSLGTFLKSLKRTLGSDVLRFTGNTASKIQKVAICGGSGSDLLSDAIAVQADVFITADIHYHTFHSAVDKIALVDAGHWETEQFILNPVADRLRSAARLAHKPLSVYITKHLTNPIQTI
jgi:dinuclear metal center YbgI/SA1388 family protein